MADEISDDKFKSEVMRFIEVANQKFDGLAADVRTNSFKLDRLENGLNQVEDKLNGVEEKLERVASDVRQFKDVAIMAIEDHKSIENMEGRVSILEGGAY